jgi:hypothetical protein
MPRARARNDGIAKAHEREVRFGRKPLLASKTVEEIRSLREAGETVPTIMHRTGLSKGGQQRSFATFLGEEDIRGNVSTASQSAPRALWSALSALIH